MFFKIFNRKKEVNLDIEQLQKLKKQIIDFKLLYDGMNQLKIRSYLVNIITTSEKILNELLVNKKKIGKMNLFIDYYLPEIFKISSHYKKLSTLESENANRLRKEIEEFFPIVEEAFNKIYEELINAMTTLDADIEVMLMELKNKSLIGEDNE